MARKLTRQLLLVCFVSSVLHGGSAGAAAAQQLESIVANDNRTSAGRLRNGVFGLQLEIRKGVWHPEREDGEGIPVYAFGETGKPLLVPGPLVRVPQGTTIAMSIRNSVSVPVTLYGLHERPGRAADTVTVAPGAVREIRFEAGKPGTYLYYGRTPDGQRGNQRVLDSQLGGAFIVDASGPPVADRVLVLGRWNGAARTAINGKSWPYTERLTYTAGETVRWRVVNASNLSHPMHLHGAHFNVDGVGDGETYQAFEPTARPLVFTHSVAVYETFDMSWVPREPGRWLYHCHRVPHMRLPITLDPKDVIGHDQHEDAHHDPDYAGMGGMILGITVLEAREHEPVPWRPVRRLELTVSERNGDSRYFEVTTSEQRGEGERVNTARSEGLSGPPIVLVQHQPVEIAVVNRLKEPTSIHWHGIELESYYDGVPEWGGIGARKTPPVNPGDTFVARMAPPRAGTFMYHTHWHDAVQLTGGVHGPLIVVPEGQTYDPATDKNFLFSNSPAEPFDAGLLLMNGSPQPATMEMKTRTKYRLRLMNITPGVDNLRVSLRHNGLPVQWKALAKDAVDLPASSGATKVAEQQLAIGETFDFEYQSDAPQVLTLDAVQPNNNRRVTLTLVFTDSGAVAPAVD